MGDPTKVGKMRDSALFSGPLENGALSRFFPGLFNELLLKGLNIFKIGSCLGALHQMYQIDENVIQHSQLRYILF